MITFDKKGRPIIGNQRNIMVMGKFTKKPIPIEAFKVQEEFQVTTLEGVMKGKRGDYLIIGIHGEAYPCDAKIFEESYERVKTIHKQLD